MNKYVVDFLIHGYEKVDIEDEKLSNEACDLVIVLSDRTTKEMKYYYRAINNNIRLNGKTTLIAVKDKCDYLKPLATLMVTFRKYDIYEVISDDIITAPYLKTLESREPDFNEVQTFIGGDVTAYSELSTIMIGIENLVEDGDINGLINFINSRMATIESLNTNLDYMKSICELYNIEELDDKIFRLEEQASKNKKEIEKYTEKCNNLQLENEKINNETAKLKLEVADLKSKNESLKESVESGGSAIVNTISECLTSQIVCKTKHILYFKEISYVPYVNTMITHLLEMYKKYKMNVKLVIYDNKTELYKVYNPLSFVNGKTYVTNKSNFIQKTDRFVVTEPVPMIINDILSYDPGFDVVIVYDRMKSNKNIVEGNNVTKFFILNSRHEYEKLISDLDIMDDRIISRSDVKFSKDILDIPYIESYKESSDSAKIMKYKKLTTSIRKVNLINAINSIARIEIKEG